MKKALCLLLTVMLIFQMVTPAFAYTQDTINNTTHENLTILDSLQSLYGDELTEDDVLGELSNMGLLDNEGNLNISQSIMVDGTPMTLEQLKAMLNDDGVDLDKKVSVDGTELTLRDLKVMIEIEDELARIKETYLSGSTPFTNEHKESYNSLLSQIQNDGIMLERNMVAAQSTEIAINHDVRLRVRASATKFTNIGTSDAGITLRCELIDKNGNETSLGYEVSFDLKTVDGSAKSGTHYKSLNTTITIPKGFSTIMSGIDIYAFDSTDSSDMRWDGNKVFLIQMSNPENILFDGETRAKNIAITLSKDYDWMTVYKKYYEKTDSFTSYFTYDNPSVNITALRPGVLYQEFYDTVDDIVGGVNNADFELNAYIIMLSEDNQDHTFTSKPMLKNLQHVKIESAQYGYIEDYIIKYRPYEETVPRVQTILNPTFEDRYGAEYAVTFSGEYPGSIYFTEATIEPYIYRVILGMLDVELSLIDIDAPTVKSINAPAGNYYSGQVIPIYVEFSEPVKFTNLTLTMQGENTSILPAESAITTSKFATFLYTLPKNPNNDLVIGAISNIKDILGNTTTSWPADNSSTTISGITMEPDPLLVFESLSLVNEPYNGYLPNDTIEIKLEVDTSISQWLEDGYNLDGEHLESVYIKAGSQTYPLTMGGSGSSEGSYYTASIPASDYASTSTQSIAIELYTGGSYMPEMYIMDPDGLIINPAYFYGGSLVIGMSEIAEIAPLILVESITLDSTSYPDNNIIYSTDRIELNASISPPNASFQELKWESSDETIALIDELTGAITPVSKGEVTFRAISNNGGMGGIIYSEVTPVFTVINDGPPTIVFPKGNNAFVTKKNEEVKIAWNQNLIDRTEGVSASFTVELFSGNFSSEEDIIGSPVYTATVTDISRYTIPINTLSFVSNGTDPAYTIKVSAENPEYPSEIISDIGYIIVYPQPARVYFDEIDNHYITDDIINLNIRWTLSEFIYGDFEFSVVKNQDVYYKDTTTNGSGSYTLNISSVGENNLKDIYTVTIKAKNTLDNGWSTDSFILHVYNKNSLNILVDVRT